MDDDGKRLSSSFAGVMAAGAWLAIARAAWGAGDGGLLPDKLAPIEPSTVDTVWRAVINAWEAFFIGGLLVVALLALTLYQRYFSSYMPKPRFRAPTIAKLAAIAIPFYGITCAIFGMVAGSGNTVAIVQAGAIPPLWLTLGGLAAAVLALLTPMGRRWAGVLLVALLAADFGVNLSWASEHLESVWVMPLRIWSGLVLGVLSVWGVAAVFQQWAQVRAKARDVRRLSGPR